MTINSNMNLHLATPVNFMAQSQEVQNSTKETIQNDFVKTPDKDEFTSKESNDLPPNIGTFRLITGFLTDKQIEEINKTGKLPNNAKFVQNGMGGYTLSNNFFGLRVGTQKIPQGFEVKKNIIGQAVVLPVGSDGLLIK